MSRDVLARAVEAYRVETDQAEVRSAETLRRIVESDRQRRRVKPLLWVAALTCSAVAVAGIRELPRFKPALPSVSSTVPAALPAASTPVPTAVQERRLDAEPRSTRAPTVAAAPDSSASKRAARKVSSSPSPAVLALARLEPPERQGAVPEQGSLDPEDVLFDQIRKAHETVPVEEDLASWERYLSNYPDGRFAPEARYRKALALARLGRGTEALSAFLWFTDNDEGKYRREDALRWIRALSQEP